jgi:hypothetical protein
MAGGKFDLREVQTSLGFLGLTTIFVGSYFVSSATPGTGDAGNGRRALPSSALVNDEVSHYRIPLAPSAACVAFHFLFRNYIAGTLSFSLMYISLSAILAAGGGAEAV